jgi:hypothetical protein
MLRSATGNAEFDCALDSLVREIQPSPSQPVNVERIFKHVAATAEGPEFPMGIRNNPGPSPTLSAKHASPPLAK